MASLQAPFTKSVFATAVSNPLGEIRSGIQGLQIISFAGGAKLMELRLSVDAPV
jgi:hypothetical protein